MDYKKVVTKTIGNNIRHERNKRELTIEELSEYLDITPGFLGLIERGDRGTNVANLCRISEFFSITLDDLIRGDREDHPEGIVAEPSISEKKKNKYSTAISLFKGLNDLELEFIISTMKNIRKLRPKEFDSEKDMDSEDSEE